MFKTLLFSKMLKSQTIPQLIGSLQAVGVDGVDLAVRDGFPINPSNARRDLPKAAAMFKAAGLSLPLVSLQTNINRADMPGVETCFAACHDAGVPLIKVGYWPYKEADYFSQIEASRKDLAAFESLAERFGVKALVHIHSGQYLSVNVAGALQMVRGLNPLHVGLYLDPGHLALYGEPIPMAISMARPYLTMIAVKNPIWEGKPRKSRWVPVGEGLVDWKETLGALKMVNYAGYLSLHSEYEGKDEKYIVEQSARDLKHLRSVGY